MRGRWTTTWKGGGAPLVPLRHGLGLGRPRPRRLDLLRKEKKEGKALLEKNKTTETRKEKGKDLKEVKIYKKYIFAPDNKLEHPK